MLLDTPNITRPEDWVCGRVALEVMLGHHGVRIPRAVVALANPVRGLSDETAEAAVRSLVPNVATGHWGLEELRHFLRQGRPVMVLVSNFEPADHWVVVRGLKGGRVHYHDDSGRASKPVPEFGVWWTGPADNPLRNFGLCGWP